MRGNDTAKHKRSHAQIHFPVPRRVGESTTNIPGELLVALTAALAGVGIVGSGSLHVGPATPPVFEFHQARDELSRTATQICHCGAVFDCALQQA